MATHIVTLGIPVEAQELECQLCLQEVELLRRAVSPPGLLDRIWGNLKLVGGTLLIGMAAG